MGRYDNRTNDEILDARLDKAAGIGNSIFRHPFRWGFGLIAILIALSLVSGVVNFGADYAKETKRVVSVPNVREQTTAVINARVNMEQAAINYCSAKNSKSSEDDPTLIEDPAFAYGATYRTIKAEYDRRMANFFEAAEAKRVPLPDGIHGYPKVAPSLKEAVATAEENGDC